MMQSPQAVIAQFVQRVQWVAVAAAAVWLIWILTPVLPPFVCAAILGWMGNPLVVRLQERGWSRTVSVMVVFFLMLLAIVIVVLLLVPMIQEQITILVKSLPRYQQWFYGVAIPWLESKLDITIANYLDLNHVAELVQSNWERIGGVAKTLWAYASRSGFALFGWMANLVLIPVLTFFFLRDWGLIVDRVAVMIPRNQLATVTRLATESSSMLSGFLRGQISVMLILGFLYGMGLWAVGLDLGVLIGLIAGLLTFVPYLGPVSGVLLGMMAALMQYGDWKHLTMVAIVFGIGQVIESYILTPKLVGYRIGLHPMAVIFAILACGQLFGFLGMLLALPIAAVANVLLRYARERYTHSYLYVGDPPIEAEGSEGAQQP